MIFGRFTRCRDIGMSVRRCSSRMCSTVAAEESTFQRIDGDVVERGVEGRGNRVTNLLNGPVASLDGTTVPFLRSA